MTTTRTPPLWSNKSKSPPAYNQQPFRRESVKKTMTQQKALRNSLLEFHPRPLPQRK